MTTMLKYDPATVPERMKGLPVDPKRGFLIPWFVSWQNGEPEFRAVDAHRWVDAVVRSLCWVCGQKLGTKLAFVLGPMCGVNRTSVEPPCHRECAEWSARNCPFLTKPNMVRREGGLPDNREMPGIALMRNPGAIGVWITRSFEIFNDGRGGRLLRLGDPLEVLWFAEGRAATRAEVEESVRTGLPELEKLAEVQGDVATKQLARQVEEFRKLLPAG